MKYFSRKCYAHKINGSTAFTVSKLYLLPFSNIFVISVCGGSPPPHLVRSLDSGNRKV